MDEIKLKKSSFESLKKADITRKSFKKKSFNKKLGDYEAYNSTVNSNECLVVSNNSTKRLPDLNNYSVSNLLKLFKKHIKSINSKILTPDELIKLFELKKYDDEICWLLNNIDFKRKDINKSQNETKINRKSSYIIYDLNEHMFKIVTEKEETLKLNKKSKEFLISRLKCQNSISSDEDCKVATEITKVNSYCEHCAHCNLPKTINKRVNKELVKSGDSDSLILQKATKNVNVRNPLLVAELKSVLKQRNNQQA